jgi:mRNA-degrading endonuclease YafQ of YafQ-DinJ toxin-antitoxin module
MKQLKEAMLLLIAKDTPLPAEGLDHPLVGEWTDDRE